MHYPPGVTSSLDSLPLRRIPVQSRSVSKVLQAIDAAEFLLDEHGPDALNLTRVARQAGLSPGALHQYLPDRETIVAVLATRYHQRLEDLLRRAITEDASQQPVRDTLAAIVQVYRDESALRMLRLDGLVNSVPHKDRMARLLEEAILRRGLATPQRAAAVARVVFLATDAVLHAAFSREGAQDEALLVELERMLSGYLSP